ncbi:putative Na+-dependent transporter [Gloeocapsa sp. PCC 73106]|nr:putative Na+-dependent transporter [Gloeocapsa sp. PCC 73106]
MSEENLSPFTNLSNTELAVIRTDLATERKDLAKDRNRMAAERTLMAWIRTSLSMITFGFGIDRFFHYLKRTEMGTSVNAINEERVLGLSLITLGVFALAFAIVVHWNTLKKLEEEDFQYTSKWSLGITVAIVLVFIGLASYIPIITQDINMMEIFSLDSQVIQNFAFLTVFSIILTLGVELSLQNLLNFWRQPSLLIRSLLAVIVIPPLVVALTLLIFKLPEAFVSALVLLVASPGPALLTRRAAMAGARFDYIVSLQVTLAILAIVFTPLTLKFFSVLSPYDTDVNFLKVAYQVASVQFFPLSIGFAIRTIWSDSLEEISSFLRIVSNTLFIVLSIILLLIGFDVVPVLGVVPILVAIILTLLGLAIGHLFGIGYEADIQSGMAVTTIARNAGLAIFIALFKDQARVVPVIVGVLIIGIVAGLPYSIWMKRKII